METFVLSSESNLASIFMTAGAAAMRTHEWLMYPDEPELLIAATPGSCVESVDDMPIAQFVDGSKKSQ
jgi:hypothetical protein